MLSLIEECDLQLTVTLVSSANNKAESLTRVPQRWLKATTVDPISTLPVCAASVDASDKIAQIHHSAGHPGVKRTLYFVKRTKPATTRRQVQAVVGNCEMSIH